MDFLSLIAGIPSLGILYFLWKEGIISFNSKKNGKTEDKPQWAHDLIEHFNHDTTSYHEKTHEKLDKLNEGIVDLTYTLKDIKENGINCKK